MTNYIKQTGDPRITYHCKMCKKAVYDELDTLIAQTITDTCQQIRDGLPEEVEEFGTIVVTMNDGTQSRMSADLDKTIAYNQAIQSAHKIIDIVSKQE